MYHLKILIKFTFQLYISSLFKKPAAPKTQVVKCFIGGLRSYNPPVQTHEALKVTKHFKPFNLSVSKKKSIQQGVPNPSMAEGVQKWEKKTPERFHSSRQGEVFRMVERVEMRCTTEAHTPQLMAVKRHRPVYALSREAKEQSEFEEMKKSQFKAHGVDERVFKPPVLPVKKESKPTKIEAFHLTESHKKENVPSSHSEESDYKFHAKPAPKFEHPLVDRKQAIPVTVPHTPKFSEAGKASLQSWRRPRSRSNGRLKKVMEEERKKREFHANPCPNFSNPALPERPTLTTTRPAPFQLNYDTRGASKKEKFLQQLEEMRLDERKATQFKAQPAKILNKEPFKIKLDHSQNNVTDVVEFSLSTQKRATERKNFDQFLKEREQEKEMSKIKREQELIQKEVEEAAKLRDETVFVANPVRHFKPVEIKKAESDLLTVPKTPKFMKK